MTKLNNHGESSASTSVRHSGTRIIVFAREPTLGKVKSRLAKDIGDAAALAVYEAMLARVARLLTKSGIANWDLWITSNPSHESFVSLCNTSSIFIQQGEDLGARMDQAIQHTLERGKVENVILIGTDCPAMTEGYLEQAVRALESDVDVVLGPAEDGGYVLIAMRNHLPKVFEDIPWGGDEVLGRTLENLRENRLRYSLLDELWDVDLPEDLARTKLLDPPLSWA